MFQKVIFSLLTVLLTSSVYAQTTATSQLSLSDTSKKEESKYVSFFRDDDPMLMNMDSEDKSTNTNGKKKKVKGRDRKKAMSDRALADLNVWLKEIKNPAPLVSSSDAA